MTNTMKRLAVLLIGTLFVLCVAIVLAVSLPVSTAFAAEETATDTESEATVHDHTDGTWTELTADGGTLQSGNYYLAGDVTLTTDITIADNAVVTLCLNGYKLTGTGTSSVIIVGAGASFTLEDCSADASALAGTGVITGGIGSLLSGSTTRCGGGVLVNNGTFTMTGGTISGNTARTGGGVDMIDGTFTMTGGTISDNTANRTGGGVYVTGSNSKFTLENGIISGNTAEYGGGVYVVSSSTFTLSGGTISGNTAAYDGGGVFVGGTFTMEGGTISDNTAARMGGGVYISINGTFTMNGGTISGNTVSQKDGGGVYVEGTFILNKGEIAGNYARHGGGVCVSNFATVDFAFTMNGGTISGNTARTGGGVYGYSSGTVLKIDGGTISGNTSDYGGGGVYVGSSLVMTGGTISENYSNYGSGVYVVSSSTFTLSGGTISGNTAAYDGGGVEVHGTFTMEGGTISGNTAIEGGGVYVDVGSTFTMIGGYFGGEIYSDNGTVTISGGYFAEAPQAEYIAADCVSPDISAFGGALFDSDYIEGFPYAVYKLGEEFTASASDTVIYDGSPVEEGVDFTVTGADELKRGYMYKQAGGEYVAGLPAEAGEYTILACALDSVTKTYYETEFVISIKVFATLTFDGQTNNYGSIVEAVNAAKALGTTDENRAVIKLLDNVDLPSTLLINTGFVTLDLNGYIIKMTGSGSVIQINGGADVILTDGSSDVTHNYYVADGGLWVFYEGELPAEAPENATTGTVTGGVITGGNAATGKGGGVYAQGTFTMSGGAISGNSADSWGGGVYIDGGTFTMSGGMISGNRTMYNGGGVCVDGTFTMSGGTISGNTASIDGGGVCVDGTFTMSGGTISDNMAAGFVGGVYVLGGTFTMTGGTISGNTASSNCGGVYIDGGTFTMNGGTISGNTAPNGGGVYVLDGEFTMNGGTISGNTVSWIGSGVYVYSGTFTMNGGYLDGTIVGSTVSISGGYFSEAPEAAYIAENHTSQDISVLGGAYFDSDYIEGFPYAVYKNGTAQITASANDNIVYDGSPVEEGTDFTVTGADGMTLGYMYKQEGGEYVSGLPTDAGEYTILACALDYAQKTYYETTFELNIQKAAPSYTKPTDIKACVEQTLADIKLPEGWTWEDGTLSVGEAGKKQFKAIFTPEDTSNYNTVEESVTVTVTAHTGGTATCTDKAVCSVCGMKYGELAPHVFDQKVTTEKYLASEATCTHKATYYYSCECGAKGTETFEYGELTPHVFDQKVATAEYLASEATCTQKATYYYSCVCGEKDTETFEYGELAEHTAVEIPAVEATCTQSGMTAGSKCSVCGEILVAPEKIAPLGHIDENGDELCDRCGFDMSIPEFTITVTGGTIEGAIGSTVIVEENGSVTVVASEAPEGKEFKGWSIDGGETIISAEAAYTFTASGDTVLTAVFADKQSDVKPGGEITPENPEGLSGGAIAGIVIGSVFGALIIAYGVCALLYKKKIVKGAFFEKIYPFIKD